MKQKKNTHLLNERLNQAYKRIPFHFRKKFRKEFCEVHQITQGTFRHKLSGGCSVAEMECEWWEAINPYEQTANA